MASPPASPGGRLRDSVADLDDLVQDVSAMAVGRTRSGGGRTLSGEFRRRASGLVGKFVPTLDADCPEEDAEVSARRAARGNVASARDNWTRVRDVVTGAAAFHEAGLKREASNNRRINDALQRSGGTFDANADVMVGWWSRAKIVTFEGGHVLASAFMDRLWFHPSNVLFARLFAALVAFRRHGVPMGRLGSLSGIMRDAVDVIITGRCLQWDDLYVGLVPRLIADALLAPLLDLDTWYDIFQHYDYLQTGLVRRDTALEYVDWMDTPTRQLALRFALLPARLACEIAFARAVLGDSVPASNTLLSWGGLAAGLHYGLWGIPWDVVVRVVFDVGNPISDDGDGATSTVVVGHLVSSGHLVGDRRGFAERWAATSRFNLLSGGLAGMAVGLIRTYIPPILEARYDLDLGLGEHPLMLPWWLEGLLSFQPAPDLTMGDYWWGMVAMMPYAFPFGMFVGYPVEWLYTRTVYRPIKRLLFEDDEHHMHRKLRHARGNFASLHAKVSAKPSLGSGSADGVGTDGSNQGIDDNGMAAATETLDEKREALLERCAELLDAHRIRLGGAAPSELKLVVKREDGLGPVLSEFATVSQSCLLAGNIHVEFEGELGMDMGGVSRDFFENVLSSYINDPKTGLFAPAPDGGLLPKKGASKTTEGVRLFALGRLMALAVTSGIPLSVRFSRMLYKVLLGEEITADEVQRIDPNFAEHRIAALLKPGGVAELESVLCEELTFVSVPGDEARGEVANEQVDLVESGSQIRVTEKSKHAYVQLLVEHYLVGYCRGDLAYLVEGFFDILPQSVLRGSDGDTLSAIELELIVTGLPNIDVNEWKQHTTGDLLKPEHATLAEWFWDVVESMSNEERAMLLSFACGAGRLPAGGFAALQPPFSVEVNMHESADHHPSAHTCFNQLCLPGTYGSREELRKKLGVSIREGKGFGFV
eukprot:m.97467 g.97467  ORF g.97467 m.97467 type:complete len:935 (-) comp10217_c0_seq1:217-3021(-)